MLKYCPLHFFRMQSKEVTLGLKLSEDQAREAKMYLEKLSAQDILFGLRFAYNRQTAIEGGYLFPGRKSKVKLETRLLSADQAKWRIKNWKSMIRTYREKGYSYPTICRIKKQLNQIIA